MAENDDTRPARNFKGQSTILALILELGGGMMPETGAFNTTVWGLFLGVDARTIERYVKNYNIPYRQPGKDMFIDAEDFRRHVPYHNGEESPEE